MEGDSRVPRKGQGPGRQPVRRGALGLVQKPHEMSESAKCVSTMLMQKGLGGLARRVLSGRSIGERVYLETI